MPTKSIAWRQRGFTLVEMLVAVTIGVILIGAVIGVYLAQSQVYKGGSSQAAIQNAENAISALVGPTVRAAGFTGCGSVASTLSNLIPGGPPPLGTLGTTPTMIAGYEANGTSGAASNLVLNTANPSTDYNPLDWSPTLAPSLVGAAAVSNSGVVAGSDVLIVLGAAPGAPVAAVAAAVTPSSLALTATVLPNATSPPFGTNPDQVPSTYRYLAISDCLKSTVFLQTGVAYSADLTTATVNFGAGGGILQNAAGNMPVGYAPGSQVVAMQQTAFYVGNFAMRGNVGQPVLMRATLQSPPVDAFHAWVVQPLVPGVESMQVLYGIGGANGVISNYVAASAVPDWTSVYAVRIAFLIHGDPGSAALGSAPASAPILDGWFTPPADTRLRHVYEMTINLRNAQP